MTLNSRTRHNPDEGKYLYSVIKCDTRRTFPNDGIGGRGDKVYTIPYDDLAAVVSDTPLVEYDPTPANALAHEQVNETVMEELTLVPVSFGTVFRSEDDVVAFLRDTADTLRDALHKLQGTFEFGLKITWDTDQVLQQVKQEPGEVSSFLEAMAKNPQHSGYFANVELGRLVDQALKDKADSYIREVYNRLSGCALASRENQPIADNMILNAAFLVSRDQATEVCQKVEALAQDYDGQLHFTFTGPWPPYNFVNIRLKVEPAGSST